MKKSINDIFYEQLKKFEITDYNDQIIPGENVIVFKKGHYPEKCVNIKI
jgi:hypothetical protein